MTLLTVSRVSVRVLVCAFVGYLSGGTVKAAFRLSGPNRKVQFPVLKITKIILLRKLKELRGLRKTSSLAGFALPAVIYGQIF